MERNCVYHDDDMVQLITYGPYIPEKKVHYERVFSVHKNWLMHFLNGEGIQMDKFLDQCTLDDTLNVYVHAANSMELIEVAVV